MRLNDPNVSIASDYHSALERQAEGRCLVCGVGQIREYSSNQVLIAISSDCGHGHKGIEINESIGIRESIGGVVVPEGRGKRHFVFKFIQGWFASVDAKLPSGVMLEQVIDKRNNLYKKKVVDAADQNTVIKDQNQSLTDHQGYGSAKFRDN
jgi:hypothetical protein